MKARLIKSDLNVVKLLCTDGTICNLNHETLLSLLFDFKNVSSFSGNDGRWSLSYKDMSIYPGETIAYIADDLSLVIMDASFFSFLSDITHIDSYISLVDYAKKVNRSEQIIKVMCRDGRVFGARKINGRWMIPENAPYPVPQSRRHKKASAKQE